jgi:hypothetical protein
VYFQYFMKYFKFQPVFFGWGERAERTWRAQSLSMVLVLITLAQRLYFSLALLVFLLWARLWFEALLHHWLNRCQLTIWRKGHYYPREWYRSMSMNRGLKNIGYSSALGVGISPDLPHNFSPSRSFCSLWFETQSSWSVGWGYPI